MARNRYYDDPSLKSEAKEIGDIYIYEPVIFLSHISEDKKAVKEIGDYILSLGIDIYLDIKDEGLQDAIKKGNDRLITKYIEKGIKTSTHLLAVVSEDTKKSWWVPYEIGYGKGRVEDISVLKLKDCLLPSYLNIATIFGSIEELDLYANKIRNHNLSVSESLISKLQALVLIEGNILT